MGWKQFAKDYLGFTRKERIGILALASLILVICFLPRLAGNRSSSQWVQADTAWISAAKRLENSELKNDPSPGTQTGDHSYAYQYDRSVNPSPGAGILFNFDPNTLEEAGWKKLGLKDKTIRTIQNYLAKGGHFYKPEDLKKIYGLHPNDYYRLEPYIKIKNNRDETRLATYVKNETRPDRFPAIDINTADTTAFISLPGIGSKLAARIVNFRNKLGGFYSVNQVGETYGLPDSTFQKIKRYLKIETMPVKKININTATVDELKAHPYIKYSVANPIVAYRNEHGPFANVEEIKKVMAVTEDIYARIVPYLSCE